MQDLKLYSTLMMVIFLALFNVYCGNSDAGDKVNENAGNDSTQVSEGDSAKADASAEGKDDKKSKSDQEAIPVEVTTITRGMISDYILLSTNLETEKMTDVYSRVQGHISKINVQEGDKVQKNQVLVELEGDEYRLAEERAKLNYLQQKSDFDRMEAMFNKDLLSKEEFEKARFATEGLKVDWEQAQLNYSYTKIKSPISGVIGDRLIKMGDRVQPSNKLFTVINTDEMIAVVYAPEKELDNIRSNQVAYISSDNIPGERFTGWIKRVSPVVDPQSGTFKVTIGVKNPKSQLRSGMFVNAHIVVDTHDDAVLIPKTAIVYENEMMNVFVVKDSIAHKVLLNTGFQDHEKVECLSGIEAGDKIIVVGQAGLKDQTKVKIVSERKIEYAMRNFKETYRGI